MRCVNLLETIDDGAIFLDGVDISEPGLDADPIRRRIGMVFQQFNLFPHRTVLQQHDDGPADGARPLQDATRRSERSTLLDRFGLADKAAAYPDQLSGGQQQRVAIVRSLAMDPEVMLLDEITSALDPELVGEVLDVVRDLKGDGMTMLIATHEMSFAREISDRVCFLHLGTLLEVGRPTRCSRHPREDRTRQFLQRVHRRWPALNTLIPCPPELRSRSIPAIDWLQRRTGRQWLLAAAVVGLYLLYRAAQAGRRDRARPVVVRHGHRRPDLVDDHGRQAAALAGTAIITALDHRLDGVGGAALQAGRQPADQSPAPEVPRAGRARLPLGADRVRRLPRRSTSARVDGSMAEAGCSSARCRSLGVDAPEIGGDVGYHLFRLPLLADGQQRGCASSWSSPPSSQSSVTSWPARSGSPVAAADRRRVAWVHLALLGAVFAGLQALDYVFVRRPSLATSRQRLVRRTRLHRAQGARSLAPGARG